MPQVRHLYPPRDPRAPADAHRLWNFVSFVHPDGPHTSQISQEVTPGLLATYSHIHIQIILTINLPE